MASYKARGATIKKKARRERWEGKGCTFGWGAQQRPQDTSKG